MAPQALRVKGDPSGYTVAQRIQVRQSHCSHANVNRHWFLSAPLVQQQVCRACWAVTGERGPIYWGIDTLELTIDFPIPPESFAR